MLFLVLGLTAAGTQATPELLVPGASIRRNLAGGQSVVYAIDVPADRAARVVVEQQGIDISYVLRPKGVELRRGLDLRSGNDGDERIVVPVSTAPATWHLLIQAALPKAPRGDYVISLEIEPADPHRQALAGAHARHQGASDAAWIGDGEAFQRAQAEYAAAAESALAAGDTALAAEATYQRARVLDSLGDQPSAIEAQRRALALFQSLERHDREARVLNRLGDLSRKVGDVTEAEAYFEKALPLAREVGDPTTIADILNNSGLLMLAVGRTEEGIEQLESAIPLAQEINSANVEGALVLNTGQGYLRLGAYDRAIAAFQRAVVVVERLNLPRRSARALQSLAVAQFESGDRTASEASMARALELYEKSGDKSGMADALTDHGRMLHASGERERAADVFARAVPVLETAQNRIALAYALTAWADLEIARGDTASALTKVDEALRLARAIANPGIEHYALYVRALAFQRKGAIAPAIESIGAATSGVETMRGTIVRSEFRTSYLARLRRYFDLEIDLLLQQNSTVKAFEAAQRARARTLLDGLAESAARIHKGVEPALIDRQRAVQAQLNAREIYRAQVALREGAGSARAAAVGREVDRLLDEWKQLRAKIRAASPSYARLHSPEPVTLDHVQQALLDPDTVLLEYHLGEQRSVVWVVDRGSITVHTLPATRAIEAIARPYHELLSRELEDLDAAAREQRGARLRTLGRELADMIWTPVAPRVRSRRVLIVADGVLQYVPFAALPSSSGAPLIVEREVVSLPSVSVLESIRDRSRPISSTAAIAVVADPVFSKNDPRFGTHRDSSAPTVARAADGGDYERLRFSRREAEAILAVSPTAFAALDFTAAKRTLEARDLRKFRILHFATHGTLNTGRPELSGLVLSLLDQRGKPADGFLRLHEIYNLDLDADLVVLSACRTALGREVHGEGLIGLTRGFMFAGASRIISSVWNVDDRASALLMEHFYQSLLTKQRPAASALREAQLSLLRQPRWADPHYWAAFGLQGDWK